MKNLDIKWLTIGVLTYIAGGVLLSSILIMVLMQLFNTIPPAQLPAVEPTASIIAIAQPLIGFALALLVSSWVYKQTKSNAPKTVWYFAGALTLYGVLSIFMHPEAALLHSILKLAAPWVIALLAVKLSLYKQRLALEN
ncbi:hypothetical protein [Lysobacter sp. N42]|uniref:hypothetical protein n=2 Tax=Gammaproteobacteria TaxID=1236 RepID=UPI000DCF8F0A|nr:hypothetical protein [Lysobacter sp. N42]